MGVEVDPENDTIKIDGTPIVVNEEKNLYIALNKPAGFLCTRAENLNRKTVMELIPKRKNLKPVGRLDRDTEGLILFSNDGEFIYRYTHPKYELEKEYFAEVEGELTLPKKYILEKGIVIEGKKTARAKISIIKKGPTSTTLKIIIHEGRKRQIRKMFDFVYCPVKYLQRIRIGTITLGNLKNGEFRYLTNTELNAH